MNPRKCESAYNETRITRFTAPPTKFDKAEFGTQCSVLLNDSGTQKEMYIQTSDDADDVNWISAKELLLAVYEENLSDPSFLRDLLDMYRTIDNG